MWENKVSFMSLNSRTLSYFISISIDDDAFLEYKVINIVWNCIYKGSAIAENREVWYESQLKFLGFEKLEEPKTILKE